MPRAVVLTRAGEDNAPLAALLRARGHEVVELPCIRTAPVPGGELAAALAALTEADRLVVTSAAGADAVLRSLGGAIAAPVATVGRRAAAALARHGVAVDLVAATGAELARAVAIPRGVVLLARSDRALGDLPALLRSRGAAVREVVAYRTVARADGDAARAGALLAAGAALVVASPSAVDALLSSLGGTALARAQVIATGPTTAAHVRARVGTEPTVAAWERVAEVVG